MVERFPDFFPNAQKINGAQAVKKPESLLRLLRTKAKRDGYSSIGSGLEIAAINSIIANRPKIVHFLYADHDYHYLAWLIHAVSLRECLACFRLTSYEDSEGAGFQLVEPTARRE